MPVHDKVEDVDKYLRNDTQLAIQAGAVGPNELWIDPRHYIASLTLFPAHFAKGMTDEERVEFEAIMRYIAMQKAMRGQ